MVVALISATVVAIFLGTHARWSLLVSTRWRCDELPLLLRLTGAGGQVSHEAGASSWHPSLYSLFRGSLRSLSVPKTVTSPHTTTAFWTNLTIHLFGCTAWAARMAPFFWSLMAILLAGWGAWLVCPRWSVAWLAALFMALSPSATAYGAQARGYSEAIALTLGLFVALTLLCRRPGSYFRATLVLLVGLQLALTVYTMWLYCVVPVMAAAVWFFPRQTQDIARRRQVRSMLITIFVGMLCCMAVYTIDRWDQLKTVGLSLGTRLDAFEHVLSFLRLGVTQLLPGGFLPLLVLVGAGAAAILRLPAAWWIAGLVFGLFIATSLTYLTGSPGYPRNFSFLVGPMAVLAAIGAERIFAWAQKRFAIRAVEIASVILLLGLSAGALAALPREAGKILVPDWGAMVESVQSEPEPSGPRWICNCLTNHWQIDWYRDRSRIERFLDIAPGGTIEVLLGAQLGDSGRMAVYRTSHDVERIFEDPLPSYLAVTPSSETRNGVEIRRWLGTRLQTAGPGNGSDDRPTFLLVPCATIPTSQQEIAVLQDSDAYRAGVITFHPVVAPSGAALMSMILPQGALESVCEAISRHWNVDPGMIRAFGLIDFAQQKEKGGS